MKICSSCCIKKDLLEFNKFKKSKDGFTSYCKDCAKIKTKDWVNNNASKRAINQRNYYLRNRNKLAQNKIERLYGVTKEQYNLLLNIQSNRCDICKREFTEKVYPCVDHCHNTGQVRGLLCNGCNTNLERLRSSKDEWISSAKEYLDKSIEVLEVEDKEPLR